MEKFLFILCAITGVAHGAEGISVRPVFGKFANGIVPENQKVTFGFELHNHLKKRMEIKIQWQVSTDQKKTIAASEQTVLLSANEKSIHTFAPKISMPGFYKAAITCMWLKGKVKQSVQVGYAPEKLLPPLTSQPDLKAFWDKSRTSVSKVDPRF